MSLPRLAFLASHGGSGARAICAACLSGELKATPALMVSNNSGSAALTWAHELGLATAHLSSKTHPDPAELDRQLLGLLEAHHADLLLLSGYMKPLGPLTLLRFAGRALNIHPSLLPRHGGAGMYGDRVHAAVLGSGDRESGASVHLVTSQIDGGPVLAQSRVPVLPGDTVQSLRARVQATEGALYVQAVGKVLEEMGK